MGDRTIEIGAVRMVDGKVSESFQALMNPGFRISGFIESYTGITNQMLVDAPSCESVMRDFADFIGDDNLVAHNASFDQRFLDAEFENISQSYSGEFVCSMLMARRIYQQAPNHQLGTLIEYKNIPSTGEFHRALYDSEMTAKLWVKMLDDIRNDFQVRDLTFKLVKRVTKTAKKSIPSFFEQWNLRNS
ncbi:MAG: 3'-5' exonuclease [Kangiellaceae bacterium]|nr:3'-5' exonuclease [Kangiellaceae bacterium]